MSQHGGRQYAESPNSICVENADDVLIILAMATAHSEENSLQGTPG